MSALHKTPLRRGRGFTLVELLVVITIIGMLMALLLPAVNSARIAAQQETCKNNMRQLAVAMINYQTNKQKFPGYVQPLQRSDGRYLVVDSAGGPSASTFTSTAANPSEAVERAQSQVSWAAIILPEIDQQSVYDLMVDATVTTGEITEIQPVDVFRCPSDADLLANPDNAGLSYSGNSGGWDFTNAGDFIQPGATAGVPGDIKFNGLMFNLTRLSRPINHTVDSLRDGAQQTLLLVENIHKEVEEFNVGRPGWSWMGTNADSRSAEAVFGAVWTVAVQPSLESDARLQQQALSTINEDVNLAPPFPNLVPLYARPSSNHAAGVFNVAFAGGNAQSISPDIDYTVYQQLMTPRGRRCEDPAEAFNGTDTPAAIATFRNQPPLSPEDF